MTQEKIGPRETGGKSYNILEKDITNFMNLMLDIAKVHSESSPELISSLEEMQARLHAVCLMDLRDAALGVFDFPRSFTFKVYDIAEKELYAAYDVLEFRIEHILEMSDLLFSLKKSIDENLSKCKAVIEKYKV